jgi:hypothetical protein
MSRNNGMRAVSIFVGLLLCTGLISTAFAAGNQCIINFTNTGNISDSPITISPTITQTEYATGDAVPNSTAPENATNGNTTMGDPTNDNTITGNTINDNTTTGNNNYDNINIGNTTVNSISPSYYSMFLSSGSSAQFIGSFTNGGNETLVLTPRVVAAPGIKNNINESWVKISPTNVTVSPGSTQNFVVEVNVPWDAESGDYQATIAFTDDLLPNSTEYVNSMKFSISVQASSKIQLETSYISDTIDAGNEYLYTIRMKNVATKDATIDPKLLVYSNYYDPNYISNLDPDAVEVSAPSIIKAGEIANMTIKVKIPENTTGKYYGTIVLNVDGEVDNNYGINPQVSLDFNILEQPMTPYVKTFKTMTNDPVVIEVSTDVYDNYWLRSPIKEKPSFELGLTCNSEPVNMTLVKSAESGGASIGGYYPIWTMQNGNVYQNYGTHYADTYIAPGEIGDWKLTLLPKDTGSFGYSITVGNSN